MSARPVALALLTGLLLVARVPAQSLGLPLTNSGVSPGLTLGAELAFDDAHADFGDPDDGKARTVGASASWGFGAFGIAGTLSRWEPRNGEDVVWAPGVSGSLRLSGAADHSWRVVALVGASHWNSGGYSTTRVPLSLGFAKPLAASGLSITPWVAPRFDIQREVGPDTEAFGGRFGLSGGVEVALSDWLAARVTYDRAWDKFTDPTIFSVGVAVRP